MNYKSVTFAEIKYSEPRARLNHLNNHLAIQSGMSFRDPLEIVQEKVRLLDSP